MTVMQMVTNQHQSVKVVPREEPVLETMLTIMSSKGEGALGQTLLERTYTVMATVGSATRRVK
jgi:hypothetical protein